MFAKKPSFDNWMTVFAERSRLSVIITTIQVSTFILIKLFEA